MACGRSLPAWAVAGLLGYDGWNEPVAYDRPVPERTRPLDNLIGVLAGR
ncbi:hypothetical protein ACFQWB_01655 [Paenibacillus thermoaerophilus]|uniref:Uncharacterized protein n=1 Tax=Paenibacillus thermoaerophilus TaxID=1215385 RepID=A0ABW2UXM3_9BACL|nr:hypothetical protein [Paenibacillus thermoaerophilus]